MGNWYFSARYFAITIIVDIFYITIDELYGKTFLAKSETFTCVDTPNVIYDDIIMTMLIACGKSDDVIANSVVETKEYLKEHKESQMAVYTEKSGAFFTWEDIGIAFKHTNVEGVEYLSYEKAAAFLNLLSDHNFRKIMTYQIKNSAVSFTVSLVAHKCDISIDAAQIVLDELVLYNFTSARVVDIDDRKIKFYSLFDGIRCYLFILLVLLAVLSIIVSIIVDLEEH